MLSTGVSFCDGRNRVHALVNWQGAPQREAGPLGMDSATVELHKSGLRAATARSGAGCPRGTRECLKRKQRRSLHSQVRAKTTTEDEVVEKKHDGGQFKNAEGPVSDTPAPSTSLPAGSSSQAGTSSGCAMPGCCCAVLSSRCSMPAFAHYCIAFALACKHADHALAHVVPLALQFHAHS